MPRIDLSSATGNNTTTKFTGYIEWSVTTTSKKAIFTVSLYAGLNKNYTYGNMTGSIKRGSTTVASGTWGDDDSDKIEGTGNLICTGSFDISFDSTGKASATISAECNLWNNTGSFSNSPTINGSGTVSASAPYGASTIELGAAEVQMGKNLLISITRDSTDCKHTLKYTFGTETKTIASDVDTSYAWTVPDLADKCNDATSGTCTITCETSLSGSSLGSKTATVTLTVQDPTVPALDGGGDDITLGSECKISCPRNSSNFKLKLELEFQDKVFLIGESTKDTKTWTPGYDPAKEIPNLTYATGQLKCTTYNGTAQVGDPKTKTVRVIVPDNDVTRPSFTLDGLTLSPISSLPEAFAGLYMRGLTGLQAAFTATSEYSEVRDYAITVGSQRAAGNPASIELLISDGSDVKVTATVTDARGYSTTVNTSISVMAYQRPKIVPCDGETAVICERATEDGGLSAKGTFLAIKAGKRFTSVILNEEEQNSCILRYRWKPNNGEFCGWFTLLEENSENSETELVIANVVSSLQTSYMVEIEAADALGGSHVLTFQIMTEAVSFVLYDGPDGAGFGKYPEAEHVVDIASHMTLRVRGKLVVDGADWIGIDLADGVSESVYPYGRKEVSGFHYQVSDGNHVYVAFDCNFEYAGNEIIINKEAIPEEHRPKRTTFALCPVSNRGLALISAGTDGLIRVEWVQSLAEMARTNTTAVEWIDGYLDYWT